MNLKREEFEYCTTPTSPDERNFFMYTGTPSIIFGVDESKQVYLIDHYANTYQKNDKLDNELLAITEKGIEWFGRK